jgi:hypothetical protein
MSLVTAFSIDMLYMGGTFYSELLVSGATACTLVVTHFVCDRTENSVESFTSRCKDISPLSDIRPD